MAAGCWSETPADLLWAIIKRLRIADYVRCGAVCLSWRRLLSEYRYPPAHQLPWVMLGHNNFFSLSENKTYHTDLSQIISSGHKIIGSSSEWLISVDEVLDLHMFNPLSRVHHRPPSITTLANFLSMSHNPEGQIDGYSLGFGRFSKFYTSKHLQQNFFEKVIVSPPTCSSSNFLLAAICDFSCTLAVARVGDQYWTALEMPLGRFQLGGYRLNDIIFYRDHLFATTAQGAVLAWDLSTDFSQSDSPNLILPEPAFPLRYNLKYLVESPDGDLLQIYAASYPLREAYMANFVRVFLILGAETTIRGLSNSVRKNSALNNLGNYAIFVGQNHSFALSAGDIPELRRNCIYFTDNYVVRNQEDPKWGLTIYNMEEETIEPYNPSDCQISCPPIWFIPKPTPMPQLQ